MEGLLVRMREMTAAFSANDGERNGINAASACRPSLCWLSTVACARWLACTSPCTSAITRSCSAGVLKTVSASSACNSVLNHGRQRSRRASHTTSTRSRNVRVFGAAHIGCRPTTFASLHSIAATAGCFSEVISSHNCSRLRVPAAATYSAMMVGVCRIGVLNSSTSARASSVPMLGESGHCGSLPITSQCMTSVKKPLSQRPYAPAAPIIATTGCMGKLLNPPPL